MTSSWLPAGLPAVHELQFTRAYVYKFSTPAPARVHTDAVAQAGTRGRHMHGRERKRGRRRTLPSASKAFGSKTAGSSLLRLPVRCAGLSAQESACCSALHQPRVFAHSRMRGGARARAASATCHGKPFVGGKQHLSSRALHMDSAEPSG